MVVKPTEEVNWKGAYQTWLAQGSIAGITIDPAGNLNTVDTGALPAGWYDFVCIASGNVDHLYYEYQHRDVTNGVTLNTWRLIYGDHKTDILYINGWKLATNERLRLRHIGAATGRFYASIAWVRRM